MPTKRTRKVLGSFQYHDVQAKLISEKDEGPYLVVTDFGSGKHEQFFNDLDKAIVQFEADVKSIISSTSFSAVVQHLRFRAKVI